jgi:membrane protease YdiL (CAAX protease family)
MTPDEGFNAEHHGTLVSAPHRTKPRFDGGMALIYYVLAAAIALLLGVVLITPLGFSASIVIAEGGAFFAIPWILSRYFDTGWSQWMGRPKLAREFWGWLALAIVSFAIVQSNLPVLLDRLWPIPREQVEFYRDYLAAKSVYELALLILIAAVLPGLCEELAFRGIIHTGLSRSFGAKHAIIWGGGLFALLHLNPWTFVGLWAFGCFLGYVRERTGSIIPGMLAHALNNTLALGAFALQKPEDWNAPPEYLPWYVVAPAGIILILAIRGVHKASVHAAVREQDTSTLFGDSGSSRVDF